MIAASVKDGEKLVGMLLGWGADVNQTSKQHSYHCPLAFFRIPKADSVVADCGGQVKQTKGLRAFDSRMC